MFNKCKIQTLFAVQAFAAEAVLNDDGYGRPAKTAV